MNNKPKEAIDVIKGIRSWQESGGMVNPPHSEKEWTKAIDTVVKELEKPTYTAEDMEDFAEWCANSPYAFLPDGKWAIIYGNGIVTTAQLRELWEIENNKSVSSENNQKLK